MKRMLLRALVATSVALNLTVLGFFLFTRTGVGPTADGPGPMSTALADRLGLDAAGRQRLEGLRAPVMAARDTFATEVAGARAQMIDAIVQGDEARAEAARQHLIGRQQDFQRQVVGYLAALARTLDEGQRERLRGFLETALFPGLGGRHGRMRGGE